MANFIIKYRWWIVSFCVLLGTGFGSLIPSARTDPEIRNYVPASLPSRIRTDSIEKEFGVQDMVIVLFSDSCILTADDLNQIKDFSRGISRLDGVSSILSPFTVKSIRNEAGMMIADPLIKNIPADMSETEELKHKISDNRFAKDVVFSSDFTTAAITATINNPGGEITTLDKIDSLISSSHGHARIMAGGLPYIRRFVMKDVRRDGVIIVPVALLLMLLLLKITIGDWRNVFLPFTVVILSTAFSMGLIPLLGWKISILSLLVPIILIAVSNNYGIYLVTQHQQIIAAGETDKRKRISYLISSLKMPILFSGLTTIAGVLGLLTHSIIPARQVGILAAGGIATALIMSLFFVPALLYMRRTSPATGKRNTLQIREWVQKTLRKLASFIIKYPGKILAYSAVLTLLISLGMFKLRIETNQEKYFPVNHPVRKTSEIINNKFGGSQNISVMISGDIKDPAIMNGIDSLTRDLQKQDGVGNVFSISEVVREMSKAIFLPDENGYDKIPDTRAGIAQLFELYYLSGDQSDFDQLLNFDNTKADILIKLSNPENYVINGVKKLIRAHVPEIPARITVGGYAIIMSDFAESVIRGQVYSLTFAVIVVFLLLSVIFKSFRGGVIGSYPLFASILILFGFMGITGIALDAATALLSSIMIGVGVDFTIQYMWCFNNELRNGLNYQDATVKAITTIGRSIFINAFGVMAGFSALMFSGFTSIRFFGYLVLLSIGSCLIGAMLVIPAILLKYKPRFIRKDLTTRKKIKNEKDKIVMSVTSAAFTGSRATTGG